MKQKPAKSAAAKHVYQFKIELLDIHPVIWRRVQVTDMTLDQLHECIQTSMGWTNSHLHQFRIDGDLYGDPALLEDDFMDSPDFKDSLKIRLSKLLAKRKKGFRFLYEYDFGDGWMHAVTFEGAQEADPKAKYPLCMEGARACPPEDCGGSFGYGDLVKILKNKKHPRYRELLEWAGPYDPEEFSPHKATREMHKGLPDWRRFR